jgi:signal peptide peptidase SppA
MPTKTFAPPPLSVSSSLLVDLLCAPMAMRSDRLGAFVLPLLQQLSPRATPEQRAGAISPREVALRRRVDIEDGGAEDPEVMPWDEPCYTVEDGVAILRIEGPIVKGYDNFTCWYYGCMSTDKLEQAIEEIAASPNVLAVVLLVRSPGGMATGTPEASAAIARLATQKLVVAVTDTLACSAAYWMACSAPTFFTTLSADVGCIGTYIALYDYTEMLKEWGIKLELFKRGKFKAIGVMGNPLDKAAREFLDRDCGRTNDRFLAAVRAHRPGVADATMEGQWFDGEEAVELGLADLVVPSAREAIARVKAGVAGALASSIARMV